MPLVSGRTYLTPLRLPIATGGVGTPNAPAAMVTRAFTLTRDRAGLANVMKYTGPLGVNSASQCRDPSLTQGRTPYSGRDYSRYKQSQPEVNTPDQRLVPQWHWRALGRLEAVASGRSSEDEARQACASVPAGPSTNVQLLQACKRRQFLARRIPTVLVRTARASSKGASSWLIDGDCFAVLGFRCLGPALARPA